MSSQEFRKIPISLLVQQEGSAQSSGSRSRASSDSGKLRRSSLHGGRVPISSLVHKEDAAPLRGRYDKGPDGSEASASGEEPRVTGVERSTVGQRVPRAQATGQKRAELGEENSCRCPMCAKPFKRRKYLTNHIKRVHEDERTACCLTCGLNFDTNGELESHLKVRQ